MICKIDETDQMILCELRDNSKRPIRELAKKLHMHPNTVLQRIKKLEKEGIIRKYVAELDYKKMGYDIHVIVMIKVRKGRAGDKEQLNDITHIPQVQSLHAVTGAYDLIATVRVRNRDELLEVLRRIHDQIGRASCRERV